MQGGLCKGIACMQQRPRNDMGAGSAQHADSLQAVPEQHCQRQALPLLVRSRGWLWGLHGRHVKVNGAAARKVS